MNHTSLGKSKSGRGARSRMPIVIIAMCCALGTVACGRPDGTLVDDGAMRRTSVVSDSLVSPGSTAVITSQARDMERRARASTLPLPALFLRPGPFGVLVWQWIALPLLVLVAAIVGSLGGRLVRRSFARLASRTDNTWDDVLVERMGAPIAVALTLFVFTLLVPWIVLPTGVEASLLRLARIGLFVSFFWILWRLVDVVRELIAASAWAQHAVASRTLLPLGGRVAKVIILAIAAVAVLSMLNYPVASLVAGLGLGGLAFALAAQKTVENLFGAFSIGIDQPFREGDFVKVEDFVGNVESVGLRSSRFRTLDRTIITIPNGKLADMRLESFTARDRLRLATVIGLVYETTSAQMREVIAGFERVLREQPKIWPDAVVVRFSEFAASSLNIEVMAWFQTSDWSVFQGIRQEVLLQFMEVVERAGSSFAFPTQTLHLATETLQAVRPMALGATGGERSRDATDIGDGEFAHAGDGRQSAGERGKR